MPGLKLQDSALKSECSSAAPLQVTTSRSVPQFPPEAPSGFLQGGITLPSRDLLNLNREGDVDFLGGHRGYHDAICQALTCNHRLGNSWVAIKAQCALLTSTGSVVPHCRPLASPLFWFWILSEHSLSIPPNKGKRTKCKQFSKQMQKTSVHATLSLL